MEMVKLKSQIFDKSVLEATFCPEKGMNMVSFKVDGYEIMDRSTEILFDQRCAGLGALIGPHFHHRKPKDIIPIKQEDLFPHFQLLREQGITEPFSHGIARYVPWKVIKKTEKRLEAHLSSENVWKGVPLAKLEGQEFKMIFVAEMILTGLSIDLSIVSHRPSVAGLHYYYAINQGSASVEANVGPTYNDSGITKTIPKKWLKDDQLYFNLKNEADFGFIPKDERTCAIKLETKEYSLAVRYVSATKDNSWQLYHPKGSSFVCIEPLSAKDPRNPKQKMSGIRAVLAPKKK